LALGSRPARHQYQSVPRDSKCDVRHLREVKDFIDLLRRDSWKHKGRTMDLKTRERLAKLVAMLGTASEGERSNVCGRIDEVLRRHKKSWAELPELLRTAGMVDDSAPDAPDLNVGEPQPLDLIVYILQEYLELDPHDYVAVALWILHTFPAAPVGVAGQGMR
jgi:hypothetical protein